MSGNKKVLKLDCGNDCKTIGIYQESLDCRLIVGEFGASLVVQMVKNPGELFDTWVGKIPWRKELYQNKTTFKKLWMYDQKNMTKLFSVHMTFNIKFHLIWIMDIFLCQHK